MTALRMITLALFLLPASVRAESPLDTKSCEEIQNGIFDMLGLAEAEWVKIRARPKIGKDTYAAAGFWSQQAANYSVVYETFCKDSKNSSE